MLHRLCGPPSIPLSFNLATVLPRRATSRVSCVTKGVHPPTTSCHHLVGHSKETAGDKPEEGGDDVKSSWPLRAGLHTCYNGGDSGQQSRKGELISKSRLSSDCSLQLESMKAESLVIADQHAAVNTFPGLVHTARHTMGVGLTRRW